MDGGSYHCTGDGGQATPKKKKCKKPNWVVWGGLANGWENKRILYCWATGEAPKRYLVFAILLFSFISLHCSFKKAFLSYLPVLWNSPFSLVYLSYDKPRQCFTDKSPYSRSYGFFSSHVQMWELGHKEGWVPKNWYFWIVVLEKTLESPLDYKEIKPVNPKRKSTLNIHWKDWCRSSNTLATWCEELTHWKRLLLKERLKAKGEEGDRGWDGWMASLTQWTWVWENCRR